MADPFKLGNTSTLSLILCLGIPSRNHPALYGHARFYPLTTFP